MILIVNFLHKYEVEGYITKQCLLCKGYGILLVQHNIDRLPFFHPRTETHHYFNYFKLIIARTPPFLKGGGLDFPKID